MSTWIGRSGSVDAPSPQTGSARHHRGGQLGGSGWSRGGRETRKKGDDWCARINGRHTKVTQHFRGMEKWREEEGGGREEGRGEGRGREGGRKEEGREGGRKGREGGREEGGRREGGRKGGRRKGGR